MVSVRTRKQIRKATHKSGGIRCKRGKKPNLANYVEQDCVRIISLKWPFSEATNWTLFFVDLPVLSFSRLVLIVHLTLSV